MGGFCEHGVSCVVQLTCVILQVPKSSSVLFLFLQCSRLDPSLPGHRLHMSFHAFIDVFLSR